MGVHTGKNASADTHTLHYMWFWGCWWARLHDCVNVLNATQLYTLKWPRLKVLLCIFYHNFKNCQKNYWAEKIQINAADSRLAGSMATQTGGDEGGAAGKR